MSDPLLAAAIEAALKSRAKRVRELNLVDGRRFWMKRPEVLSGWMRLQKGNPRRAFDAELRGLLRLGKLGHAVPVVVDKGASHLVIPDVGPTLRALLWKDAPDLLPAFSAAGHALARMHLDRFAHGRPAIRDICWNGAVVHFIDLERMSRSRRGPRGLALDLMIFVHSILADGSHEVVRGKGQAELEAALAAYRKVALPDVWAAAVRMAKVMNWLRPIAALRPGAREWRAFGPTVKVFLQAGRESG